MGSLIPWGKRTEKKSELVPVEQRREVATRRPGSDIAIRQGGGSLIQVRPKQVMLGGKRVNVDPYQLIGCIKRVTQSIGEYKNSYEDVYSAVIVSALRKARGDLVNILENEFHIHFRIDAETGESIFYT